MVIRRSSLVFLLLALSSVAACSPVGRSLQQMGTTAHQKMNEFDHKMRDYLDGQDLSGDVSSRSPVQESYCYKTLGEVECYAEPVASMKERMVGKQVPKPTFDESNIPYPQPKPPAPVIVEEGAEQQGNVLPSEGTVAPEPSIRSQELPSLDSVPAASVTEQMRQEINAEAANPDPVTPSQRVPSYQKPKDLIPVFDEDAGAR